MTDDYKVWTCKIIVRGDKELPPGFDAPPRSAAEKAIADAGFEVLVNASGWGGTLTLADLQEIEEVESVGREEVYHTPCVPTKGVEHKVSLEEVATAWEGYGWAAGKYYDSLEDYVDELNGKSLEEAQDVSDSIPFDLAAELERVTKAGYAPQVIYDDNGNFAISDEGMYSIRMGEDDDFHGTVCGEASWFKPTPKEAWENYLERCREISDEI